MHNVMIKDGRREITFLASAILFKVGDIQHIMHGDRHWNVIQQIAEAGLTNNYKQDHVDGFLCRLYNGDITFISRDNATLIAKRANHPMEGSVLTSEDLW